MREKPLNFSPNLEEMIDATSLSTVLEAIAEICEEKAQHLQENWQEKEESPLVRFWYRNSIAFRDHAARVESSERKLGIAP